MDLGAHLPLADLGDGTPTIDELRDYVRAARDLGYAAVSANDHLVWRRPWLDGPTALAAVAGDAGSMTLATSITLPVVRHPVVVAKTLSTLGALTGSRVIAGLGPGSSRADYDAVGAPYDERWGRFDEAMSVVRTLVHGEATTAGAYYGPAGPLAPVRQPAPEVWFGSWGSDRGSPLWRRWPTAGSPRRTTRRRRSTPMPARAWTVMSRLPGATRPRSPMRSPRPGRW